MDWPVVLPLLGAAFIVVLAVAGAWMHVADGRMTRLRWHAEILGSRASLAIDRAQSDGPNKERTAEPTEMQARASGVRCDHLACIKVGDVSTRIQQRSTRRCTFIGDEPLPSCAVPPMFSKASLVIPILETGVGRRGDEHAVGFLAVALVHRAHETLIVVEPADRTSTIAVFHVFDVVAVARACRR